jgi:MHS family alpha-ketoglutarate permease-like MFS transporter
MSVAAYNPETTAVRSAQSRMRAILGGSIGNLVEWYDWYAYAAFTLYFAKVFFPDGNQTAQLLNAAAVFAVGFFMRPIGSWLIGIYADRAGRRAALVLSMVAMGAGSLVIALTPGHNRIGILAPAILVLARVVQGLSVGGEYAASATYLSEVAGRKRRGFWSSFQYVTLIMGQLLALAVLLVLQHFLTPAQLSDWGWRVPFFIGTISALLALWFRRGLEETSSFEAVRRRASPVQTWTLMAQHPRELAIVVGLTMGGTIGFYTFSTYAQKFLVNTSGFSKDGASQIAAASLVVFMLLQPVMGWLSDLVGRRPLLIAFGAIGLVSTVPLMTALGGTRDSGLAFILVTAALTNISAYTSIGAVFKAELFPAEIRALGVGLPYAIVVSLFGGTAEYAALWLKQAGHENWFYWYVSGCMGIALITALCMRDTLRHTRIIED